mgnify:CR=1 FL=1
MTWRKASVPKKNTLMRAAVLADQNEIPDNHALTVRDRVLSTDLERIVQNNVKTDTVTLDLDGEWDDCTVYVTFNDEAARSGPWSLEWKGQPLTIPPAIGAVVGPVAVSVVGYGPDGELRLVTEAAPSLLDVVKSGYVEIVDDNEENKDILSQMVAAGKKAEDAASAANTAKQNADAATSRANAAASAANTAAGSANSAAASANAAASEAHSAAVEAIDAANKALSIAGGGGVVIGGGGGASSADVEQINKDIANLARLLCDETDKYVIANEICYVPASRFEAFEDGVLTLTGASYANDVITLV